MSLRYYTMFKSLRGDELYMLEIYDTEYDGNPVPVMGASEPFTTGVDYDDDPMEPLKLEKGTVRLINRGEIDYGFVPQTATQCRVQLKDYAETLLWDGYIVPSTYDQTWGNPRTEPTEVQFDVISAFGAWCGSRVTWQEGLAEINLAELMTEDLFRKMGNQTVYYPAEWKHNLNNGCYIPLALQFSLRALATQEDVMYPDGSTVTEDVNPTWGDVISEFCRAMGWWVCSKPGFINFVAPGVKGYEGVDRSVLSRIGSGAYGGDADYEVTGSELPDPSPAGTDHTISRRPAYYRIAVTADIQDVSGDFLSGLLTAENFTLYTVETEQYDNYLRTLRVMNLTSNSGNVTCHMYDPGQEVSPGGFIWHEVYTPTAGTKYAGAFFCQLDLRNTDESSDLGTYQWQDALCMTAYASGGGSDVNPSVPEGYVLCDMDCGQEAFYSNGAFIISGEVKGRDHGSLKVPLQLRSLRLQMHVGDYYWNGSRWVADSSAWFEPELETTTDSKKIKNTRRLNDPYGDAEGYVIPVDSSFPLIGRPRLNVLAGSYYYSENDPYECREHYLFGLSADYEASDYSVYATPLERDALHYVTYGGNTGGENFEQRISLHSMRRSPDAYGQLYVNTMTGPYEPVQELPHLEGAQWVQKRPELALLQRMADIYGRTLEIVRQTVRWPSFNPYDYFRVTRPVRGGNYGVPVGWQHNWRDDTGELTLLIIHNV